MNRSARRGARALRWLAADGLLPAWRDAVATLVTATFGTFASAAALALPVVYIARTRSGEPFTVAGLPVPPGAGTLVMAVAAALALGLLAALSSWRAELRTQALARRHQRACAARALEVAARPDATQRLAHVAAETGRTVTYLEAATSLSMTTAFALRALLQALSPLTSTAAAAAYLLWLDPRLSAVLLAIAALHAVPWLRAGRTLARRQRDQRGASRSSARALRRVLAMLDATNGPLRDARIFQPAALAAEHDRMQDALYGRILAGGRADLVAGLFLLTSLCAIVLVSGVTAPDGAAAWSRLAIYLVGLRVIWTGVRQIAGRASQIGRFVTDFEAYGLLVAGPEATAGDAPPHETVVALTVHAPSGPPGGLPIAPGRNVLALAAGSAQRSPLQATAEAMRAATPSGEAPRLLLHGSIDPVAGLSILEHVFGVGCEAPDRDALRRELAALGLEQALAAGDAELDEPLDAVRLASLSAEARLALPFLHILLAEPAIVLVALPALRGTSRPFQEALIERLGQHAVVWVDDRPDRILASAFEAVRERLDGVVWIHAGKAARSLEPSELAREEATLAASLRAEARSGALLDDPDTFDAEL